MNQRKILTVCAGVVTAYVVAYMLLSAAGAYRFDQSGLVRYGFGSAASDLEMWHPKWAWYQNGFTDVTGRKTSRGNALGYFFGPIIIIDRTFIHKTKGIKK